MNKIYVGVGVVVLLGAVVIFSMGKKAEAPVINNTGKPIPTEEKIEKTTPIIKTSQIIDKAGAQMPEATKPAEKSKPAETTPKIEIPVVKEFIISGKNFSFEPSLLTVKKGDKVKIIFENSAGFHDFVIDEYGVATKQTNAPTIEVLEFTADKAGSFEYYCSVGSHRAMGMKGILRVE